MTAEAAVCVVGSFMLDLVMRVTRRPLPGETVIADACGIFLGGKGFNQAVAARRMGSAVAMVGRLGSDEFANRFRIALRDEGIDAAAVAADAEAGTGIATPVIDPDGGNSIVIAPRANMRVTPADVETAGDAIRRSRVLLLQLEIPVEASETAARIAHEAGARVILNPAPARPVLESLLRLADVLTPNEVEAAALTGFPITGVESAFAAARELRARGAGAVAVTLGGSGVVAVAADGQVHLPAHAVPVVDTTAAGDAFNGVLAAILAQGSGLSAALRWANAAGACAVTRLGAEPSLPRREEVAVLLHDG